MRFSQPYAEFFEIHAAEPAVVEQTRRDFLTQLGKLLYRLGIGRDRAHQIAGELWSRMSDRDRHYHTPVHVLSMLSCAERAGVELSVADELAVWFHDAIYQVGGPHGANEDESAAWMEAMLLTAGADAAVVHEAAEAIRWTAYHTQEQVPAQFHTLLDLDLWGLAADPSTFTRQSVAVRAEMSHLDDEQYNRATVEFFRRLLQRPQIYRTTTFARFERVARDQVQREINRLAAKSNGNGHNHNRAARAG